jgi:hypothetical protein
VPKGNGSAAGIDILDAETEDLSVGLYDGGEGLVELPDRDIGLGESGLLEELVDYGGGCNGEVNGIWVG